MGFVTFFDSDSPDDLFNVRDKLEFKGVKLNVKRAVPKSDQSPGAKEKSKKLFIANLPKTGFSDDELMKYFTDRHNPKYGTIEKVQLIKEKDANGEKTDTNKGFGFIMVSSEDFADKLAIQHRNFMFHNRKIELKKSVPNDGGFGGGFGGPRGGGRGGRGGPRGGGAGWGNQGGYGAPSWDQGGYGGEWDQGYGGGYEGGYDDGYGGGYGGGYAQGGYGAGGGRGGRGAGGRGGGPRGAPRGGPRGAPRGGAGGRGGPRGAPRGGRGGR